MKAVYTNHPMNLPRKREEPALKTLLIMISVIALMFGIRIFCQPEEGLEDVAAMLEVEDSEEAEMKNDSLH